MSRYMLEEISTVKKVKDLYLAEKEIGYIDLFMKECLKTKPNFLITKDVNNDTGEIIFERYLKYNFKKNKFEFVGIDYDEGEEWSNYSNSTYDFLDYVLDKNTLFEEAIYYFKNQSHTIEDANLKIVLSGRCYKKYYELKSKNPKYIPKHEIIDYIFEDMAIDKDVFFICKAIADYNGLILLLSEIIDKITRLDEPCKKEDSIYRHYYPDEFKKESYKILANIGCTTISNLIPSCLDLHTSLIIPKDLAITKYVINEDFSDINQLIQNNIVHPTQKGNEKTNSLNAELTVYPKFFAPIKKYKIILDYNFILSERLHYILTFNEKISLTEFKELPIVITKVSFYSNGSEL